MYVIEITDKKKIYYWSRVKDNGLVESLQEAYTYNSFENAEKDIDEFMFWHPKRKYKVVEVILEIPSKVYILKV